MGEVVRKAINAQYSIDRERRSRAARELCKIEAPVSEWNTMKREIQEDIQRVDPVELVE